MSAQPSNTPSPISTTGRDPISELKELIDIENKSRPYAERVLFYTPDALQIDGKWVSTCKYSSYKTKQDYCEVGTSITIKKEAIREACRLVLGRYKADKKTMDSVDVMSRSAASSRSPLQSSPFSVTPPYDETPPPTATPPTTKTPPPTATTVEGEMMAAASPGGTPKCVQLKIFYYRDIVLGKGGMGLVYEGYFEHQQRKAAIKKIRLGPQDRELAGEVLLHSMLEHRNIVRYFASETKNSNIFIAMELASDTLLNVILAKKYESFEDLRLYITNAVSGLSYLHSQKVIHRDLKPNNILIFQKSNSAKIADFGISRQVESMTQGGLTANFAGSHGWMPPEALSYAQNSTHYTCHGDIFSMGLVIFYTMSHNHCHAFQDNIDASITQPDWSHLQYFMYFSLRNLLSAMLSKEAVSRPRIDTVLEHPFFWDGDRFLKFVTITANELKNTGILRKQIDAEYEAFSTKEMKFHVNWKVRLCDQVRSKLLDASQHPKVYDGTSLIFLLEFIRDKSQHLTEFTLKNNADKGLIDILGTSEQSYGKYFMEIFQEIGPFLYAFLQNRISDGHFPIVLNTFYAFNRDSAFGKL